jgi:hypothetical protein
VCVCIVCIYRWSVWAVCVYVLSCDFICVYIRTHHTHTHTHCRTPTPPAKTSTRAAEALTTQRAAGCAGRRSAEETLPSWDQVAVAVCVCLATNSFAAVVMGLDKALHLTHALAIRRLYRKQAMHTTTTLLLLPPLVLKTHPLCPNTIHLRLLLLLSLSIQSTQGTLTHTQASRGAFLSTRVCR